MQHSDPFTLTSAIFWLFFDIFKHSSKSISSPNPNFYSGRSADESQQKGKIILKIKIIIQNYLKSPILLGVLSKTSKT